MLQVADASYMLPISHKRPRSHAHYSSNYVGYTYGSGEDSSVFLCYTIRCFTWKHSDPCHSSCRSPFRRCPSVKARKTFVYITFFAEKTQTQKTQSLKASRKKYLEDKTSWRALIYMRALASHWTNIQQSKKKLVCRSNKSWPNLVSYLRYCFTFAYSSFYSPVQLKSRQVSLSWKKIITKWLPEKSDLGLCHRNGDLQEEWQGCECYHVKDRIVYCKKTEVSSTDS